MAQAWAHNMPAQCQACCISVRCKQAESALWFWFAAVDFRSSGVLWPGCRTRGGGEGSALKRGAMSVVDAVCGGCGIHKQVTAVTWVVLCQHSTAQTSLREARCCYFCYACRSIVRISCCACVFLQLGLLAAASALAPWKVQGCVFYTHNIISTRGMLMQDVLSCTVSQAVLISRCMVGMWLAGRLWCRFFFGADCKQVCEGVRVHCNS